MVLLVIVLLDHRGDRSNTGWTRGYGAFRCEQGMRQHSDGVPPHRILNRIEP